jgi:hypothetical protein
MTGADLAKGAADGALKAALLVLGGALLSGAMIGWAVGSDSRRCAVGPSHEEVTMRDMYARCKAIDGIWSWRTDPDNLELSASCIGGFR